MQGSARRIYCFLLIIRSFPFRLSCGYVQLRFCHDYTHDLSADRWLDVSFVLNGSLGIRVMMDWDEGYIPGWNLLADFQ